ncbi:UNVERIFIED_CONTAM: hypothetical protein K2H54_036185 [Gekko kuhli]
MLLLPGVNVKAEVEKFARDRKNREGTVVEGEMRRKGTVRNLHTALHLYGGRKCVLRGNCLCMSVGGEEENESLSEEEACVVCYKSAKKCGPNYMFHTSVRKGSLSPPAVQKGETGRWDTHPGLFPKQFFFVQNKVVGGLP